MPTTSMTNNTQNVLTQWMTTNLTIWMAYQQSPHWILAQKTKCHDRILAIHNKMLDNKDWSGHSHALQTPKWMQSIWFAWTGQNVRQQKLKWAFTRTANKPQNGCNLFGLLKLQIDTSWFSSTLIKDKQRINNNKNTIWQFLLHHDT